MVIFISGADTDLPAANRALGDTVLRLARDPQRKLGPTDRLIGAARLAENASCSPNALSWGIAAGYCFDDANDPIYAGRSHACAGARPADDGVR